VFTHLTYYERIISMRTAFFPWDPKFYFCDFLHCLFFFFSLSLSLSLSSPSLSLMFCLSVFCYLPTPLHETSLASSRIMEAQTTRAKWEAEAFLIYPLELKYSTHVQHGVEHSNVQYRLKHHSFILRWYRGYFSFM